MAHLLLSQCLRWLCIGLSTLSISLPDTRSRRSSTLIKQSASGGAVRDIMAVAGGSSSGDGGGDGRDGGDSGDSGWFLREIVYREWSDLRCLGDLYYPFVWQPSSTVARLFPPVICFVQLAWLFVYIP